jgi:hypothetical protein
MKFYNRCARGGSFTQGHNNGRNEHYEAKRTSLISPVGLFIMPLGASEAVVKTKLTEEKTLAGFGLTGHSEIHIQSR